MTEADQPLTIPPELLDHLARGDVVLFIGDALEGPSQSARLAAALVDACGAHTACPDSVCRAGGKCPQPERCVFPLARAAQLYESRTNRQTLVDFVLHRVESGPPTPMHRALASLPVRVMITTAYDDRLEAALREAGRPYLAVVRDTDVPFDDPERVQLIRLHGTVSQPDSLVLTEDDADDLFGRLGTVTKILQAHFASKTLLFVGYRLEDPHFRALYRQVTGPIARYRRLAYAVQWPADPLAEARWRNKITLLAAEPRTFLAQLMRSLSAQRTARPQVALPAQQPAALPPEPYKFLDYFTRDDAAIFFGRDLEANLLLATVLAHPLTVFYGRSGTGKTSLLLARVVPALEQEGYRVVYARMLGDPASEVKAAARGVSLPQLAPSDRGRPLRDVLADALPPAGRLVVVLDQFEEFFIRQGPAVREAFAEELAACLQAEGPDVRFVLSLRDDYLGALDELSPYLLHDIFAHRFKIEALTREKALLAILRPAAAFGLPVEEALCTELLDDLEDQAWQGQGLEPASLQIVLYRLYRDAVAQGLWDERRRRGAGLTLERYRALGATRQILAGYLDEVLAELGDAAAQQGARAVLMSMVTADRTKAAVSGREIARSDLVARAGLSEPELDRLLAYLRQKRVLRKFGEEERFELAHEVLVDKVWAWMGEAELRALEVRDMLRRAQGDFRKFGHLLTTAKLDLVAGCCDNLVLGEEEQELLLRSAVAAEHAVPYWRERAPAVVGKVEEEWLADLAADDAARAAQAVAGLAAVASPGLARRLAERVEAAFGDDAMIWVDHQGKTRQVRRTVLNLSTVPQRRAVLALTRMELPEAVEALARWTPPEMVLVPAGAFTMGSTEYGNEGPVHPLWLPTYWMDRYPVTNAQWDAFARSKAWRRRELWTAAGWEWFEGQRKRLGGGGRGKKDHPVVNVTWYEALAYARWAGKTLPSEAEWEKAARGPDGRRYPWGNEFDKNKCNTAESGIGGTTPVGKYSPAGDSPYGCADMTGNVWEWCRNLYFLYPYKAEDGREDLEAIGGSRVLRGGSWDYAQGNGRCAFRNSGSPGFGLDGRGFRCCWAAEAFSP